MTNQERILKAKDELEQWIEMHNGMIPSEDLQVFEEEVKERQWFIEQAEKVEQYEKSLKEIADPEAHIYLSQFNRLWFASVAKKALETK